MRHAFKLLESQRGTAYRLRFNRDAEASRDKNLDNDSPFENDPENGEIVVPPSGAVIFPGSFDPLHRGHERMAKIAALRLGKPVDLEISAANVDKPTLSADELQRRLSRLTRPTQLSDITIWITLAATFAEKANIFPEATFIVGADTIRRIADAQYYDHDPAKMSASIRRIADRGARFLVFGRVDLMDKSPDSEFQSLDEIALPEELRAICDSVDESEFREDVRSRDLR